MAWSGVPVLSTEEQIIFGSAEIRRLKAELAGFEAHIKPKVSEDYGASRLRFFLKVHFPKCCLYHLPQVDARVKEELKKLHNKRKERNWQVVPVGSVRTLEVPTMIQSIDFAGTQFDKCLKLQIFINLDFLLQKKNGVVVS